MENIDNSELRKLRDQLLEKRALQQQAKLTSNKAVQALQQQISELLDKFSDDLIKLNVDTAALQNIDYTRLQNDEGYLNMVKQLFSNISNILQNRLGELLNVQN